ncbi:type IV secretion system protein, partial [Bartonella massiliensis]|uniref:type IV secretion system protein n=1 Tax=Bartonella massiliensis TaxID=929795 RepID=UPI0011577E58
MKKIITAMIMFFGIPSLALPSIKQGHVVETISPELQRKLANKVLELLNKQINKTKEQTYEIEKIYNSITGYRMRNTIMTEDNDLLLTEPQHIYDENKETEISPDFPLLIKKITKQEEHSALSTHAMRTLTDLRSQYASIMDKVVSLQIFEETENRFVQIAQYLMALRDTQDLRAVVELQTHIKGMHAMIQNESTKLQMIAHLRNAEQTLIRQQKYKRNIKILNHQNKGMPQIKV